MGGVCRACSQTGFDKDPAKSDRATASTILSSPELRGGAGAHLTAPKGRKTAYLGMVDGDAHWRPMSEPRYPYVHVGRHARKQVDEISASRSSLAPKG